MSAAPATPSTVRPLTRMTAASSVSPPSTTFTSWITIRRSTTTTLPSRSCASVSSTSPPPVWVCTTISISPGICSPRWAPAAWSFCRVFPVPVKPPSPTPSVSSCSWTPPSRLCSRPGVSEPSCSATTTTLPRSSQRPTSSAPSMRRTTTPIPISSFSTR